MKKGFFILSVFVFQYSGAQTELTFDRPGITDLYSIVPNKAFQAEIGYDYFNLHHQQDKLPSLTLRKSFSSRFELRYIYDYALYSPSLIERYEKHEIFVHGLGTKINLWKETAKMPGISVIATGKGSLKKLANNKNYYGIDVFLVIQKAWGRIEYTNNTGILAENLGAQQRYMFGNCLSYDISRRKAIFGEHYIFLSPYHTAEQGIILGYTYQPGSRFQLDASGGIMRFSALYWFAGTGISVYLGK